MDGCSAVPEPEDLATPGRQTATLGDLPATDSCEASVAYSLPGTLSLSKQLGGSVSQGVGSMTVSSLQSTGKGASSAAAALQAEIALEGLITAPPTPPHPGNLLAWLLVDLTTRIFVLTLFWVLLVLIFLAANAALCLGLQRRATVPIELALLAVFGMDCGIALLMLCFLARPIHLDFIHWLSALWAPLPKAKDVEVADTLQGAAMMGNIQAKFRPMLERVKQALAEAEGVRLGSTDRSSMTAYSGRMSELSGSGMTVAYGEISRSSVAGTERTSIHQRRRSGRHSVGLARPSFLLGRARKLFSIVQNFAGNEDSARRSKRRSGRHSAHHFQMPKKESGDLPA